MNNSILVVDDDESVLFTARAVLESAGFSVTTVTGGEGCLQAVAGGFRGLILMDVMMPGMDGWETIRALDKAGHAEGNIIAMFTAKQDPDQAMDEVKHLVVEYIRKPFTAEELVSAARECLSYLG